MNRFYPLLLASFILFNGLLLAQEKRNISGNVSDLKSKETLPFATISLKKLLIATSTNESGNFDFLIPVESDKDTLVISYLGYQPFIIPVSRANTPLNVQLIATSTDLGEVIVKPQPPEFYIRLAMLKIKQNYPQAPFENQAYYREKILENQNFLQCNEGVFKTYSANFLDSSKNENQLLLFRKETDIKELAFMKKEREKSEAKQKKKEEKNKAKGKETKESSGIHLDLATAFGGPDEILKEGNLNKRPENFLDTNKLKHYKYTFVKASSYNNQQLMVIDFKSKGTVEHARESGKIYIDINTFAIVKYEAAGDFVVPIIVRPILFFYGLGVENPTYTKQVEFQQINSRWYPKNIMYNVKVKLKNKHFFAPDEVSDFDMEGIYFVNKTNIEKPVAVPKAKRYEPGKEMEKQVFNDEGLVWNQINIIKK